MKYYIKMECLGKDEFMIKVEDGVSYDCVVNENDSRVKIFNNLNEAKKECELSDEYVVSDDGEIVYWGKECSDCMRNLRHPDDTVDDCDNCKNTGLINMKENK